MRCVALKKLLGPKAVAAVKDREEVEALWSEVGYIQSGPLCIERKKAQSVFSWSGSS